MQPETKKAVLGGIFGTACMLGATFGANEVFIEDHADECRASWKDSGMPRSYVDQNLAALCPEVKKGAYWMVFFGVAGGVAGVCIGVALAGRKPKDPSP